jgi:hypothetical protein
MLDSSIREKARNAEVTREVVLWLAAAGGAVAISSVTPAEAAVVAGIGALTSLARFRWLLVACFASALATDVALLPWAVAAAAMAYALEPRLDGPRLDSDLQRQLMRSRRKGERAAVLVVRSETLPRRAVLDLFGKLRATDGIEVVTYGGYSELRAVLDADGLDREVVEQRVRSAGVGTDSSFGWAVFPTDGVTLDVLVDHARQAATPETSEKRAESLIDSSARMGSKTPSMAKAS